MNLRDWYDLMKLSLWVSAICFVIGIGLLVVELQSPDLVIWNGQCVPASFQDGLAYYRVGGQQYVAGDPNLPDFPNRQVTVCFYPNDPGKGYIVHPAAYWAEGILIAAPFVIGIIVLSMGTVRAIRLRATESPLPPLYSGTE